MSDLLKWIIGIILWVLLTLVSYNRTKDCICASLPFCKHDHVAATPVPTEVKRFPLDFQWSDATAFANDGFAEFKQRILREKDGTNILEIVGLYSEGEENTSTFANMGLARANEVKKLFLGNIPEERIRLSSRKVSKPENAESSYFESADFNWLPGEAQPVETFADRVVIRFPFNSVQKDVDPRIDTYLNELAARIIKTGEKVTLTGHTDNIGGETSNITLSERRAKTIRDILIRKGVERTQITTVGKGESEPISTNDTENGRHENRRVVVRLHKEE